MLTADEAVFRFSNAEGFPTKNPKSLHIVSYCNHASNSYSMLFLLVSSLKFLPTKKCYHDCNSKDKSSSNYGTSNNRCSHGDTIFLDNGIYMYILTIIITMLRDLIICCSYGYEYFCYYYHRSSLLLIMASCYSLLVCLSS